WIRARRAMTNPDLIAGAMMEWGRQARLMPRSYDSDRIMYRVDAPDGGTLGRMLPGRGFMSAVDLKSVGITRNPPNVYDPSLYRTIEDRVRAFLAKRHIYDFERGAISTYDQIISNRGNGNAQDIAFVKNTLTTTANVFYSLWRAGGAPGAGTFLNTTAPTDANLDRTSAG